MDTFDRWKECKEIVEEIENKEQKDHAKSILSQLLHIEQGRGIAARAYAKYCNEMNEWENNLVKNIKQIAKEKES